MQDPTFFPAMKSQQQQQIPQFPEQEQHLKCPRCDSTNTKFCYYNNYNLSQPRHFCKACRRYWTKGGSLRNIPVGGGTRKNSKRSSTSDTSNPNTNPPKRFTPSSNSMIPNSVLGSSQLQMPKVDSLGPPVYSISGEEQIGRLGSMGLGLVGGVSDGSFSSLLATNEHYRSLLGSFHHDNNSHGVVVTIPNSSIANSNNSGLGSPVAASIPPPSPPQNLNFWNNGGSNGGSSADSNGGSGRWSDLSIYTPGSSIP